MQRFIELDVHGQSCTLVVMGPSGRRLGEHVVETSAKALIERIRSIPGDKYLCTEERTQSEWQDIDGASAGGAGVNRRTARSGARQVSPQRPVPLPRDQSGGGDDFQRMADAGIKPNLAKHTLARRIAAATLAMWRHQEDYDPSKQRRAPHSQ
jgi:hypothetical protein